ncbi:MAG TPA: nitrilase-related carbon-nitrogen hydrolase [Thermotogota bacterium]|nr:nitrilase-related carbon-nitrogen hydrolase [Thermotogota bacterium]HRW34493.1 nitrilase-related carbon-nitrogen hydrolase [Thermotogota bacterium]
MIVSFLTQEIVQDNEEKNIQQIRESAKEISNQKFSKILLTPELSLQGFPMTFEKGVKCINKENIEEIKSIAYQYSIFIGFGYFEQLNQKFYNAYSIAGPDGTLLITQRKRKTFTYSNENIHITSAQETFDFHLRGIPTRIVICFGLRFPQLFDCEKEKPYLYIIPANWPSKRIHHWEALLIARAIENQAWVIGVNRTGDHYNGHSMVVDPTGKVVIRSNHSIDHASLDKEIVNQIRKEFPMD